VCAGSKATFTATAINGGLTPVYQWKKNGINVGTNSNTYVIDTALKNGDSIYCMLTSSANCTTTSTAISNGIKMTVNNPATPAVRIAVNPGHNCLCRHPGNIYCQHNQWRHISRVPMEKEWNQRWNKQQHLCC
jgi:hypothetical protein